MSPPETLSTRRRHHRHDAPRLAASSEKFWLTAAATVLALQAAFLGGATQGWSRGLTILLFGMAVTIAPPRQALSRWTAVAIVNMLLWSLLPLLPARWFSHGMPPWRTALTDYATLPGTLSPQPWLSAEWCLYLATAILAFSWFAGVAWTSAERRRLIRWTSTGIVLFAALCLAFHALGYEPPLWHNDRHFGPFPSRNHTGNLLAVGAVLSLACAVRDFIHGRRRAWWHLAGLFVIGAALLENLSRGGMLAALIGFAFFTIAMASQRRSWAIAGGSCAAMLFAFVALFHYAGAFSERLDATTLAAHGGFFGFRSAIWADTIRMLEATPWPGWGGGNFEAIFPYFREASVAPVRIIHPESDWLWAATELGLGGMLLILAVGATLVPRVRAAFGELHDRELELGALAALCGWISHSLIDVPGHLFGTLLPALLLLGTLVGTGTRASITAPTRIGLRPLGFLIGLGGLYLILADRPTTLWPGSSGAAHSLTLARAANGAGDFSNALQYAETGLRSAPLSWQLHFQRGAAEAAFGEIGEAQASFKAACLLQPGRSELSMAVAAHWLARQPLLALPAWREALTIDPLGAPALFTQILATAHDHAELQPGLREIAGSRPDLFTVYLARAAPAEAAVEIAGWRKTDPDLARFGPRDLAVALAAWYPAEPAQVGPLIESNPRWLEAAWPLIAQDYATKKQFEQACALAPRFTPPPSRPSLPGGTRDDLQRRLTLNPADFAAALALSDLTEKAGDVSMARFVVAKACEQTSAPAILLYRKAELAERAHDWEGAWQAWQQFHDKAPATTHLP